ncbi:MAG: helix-turn-helix domain-containing protein [Frankiaceae bacterium]
MTNRPGPLGQSIAAELRAELGRQKHSGRWLADEIGAPHNTVARWIGGETPPPLDALDAMCRALGISVADLLASVERNGGYEPVPLISRRRRQPVDNRQASGRNSHEYADSLAA